MVVLGRCDTLVCLVELEQHWFQTSAQEVERFVLGLGSVTFSFDELRNGLLLTGRSTFHLILLHLVLIHDLLDNGCAELIPLQQFQWHGLLERRQSPVKQELENDHNNKEHDHDGQRTRADGTLAAANGKQTDEADGGEVNTDHHVFQCLGVTFTFQVGLIAHDEEEVVSEHEVEQTEADGCETKYQRRDASVCDCDNTKKGEFRVG